MYQFQLWLLATFALALAARAFCRYLWWRFVRWCLPPDARAHLDYLRALTPEQRILAREPWPKEDIAS